MTSFLLRSIEHRTYHASHKCTVHASVDQNKLLVELEPAIPSWVYEIGEELDLLVLAPRYKDMSLTPVVSEWPCTVNICIPEQGGNWKTGPFRLLDIGEIRLEGTEE